MGSYKGLGRGKQRKKESSDERETFWGKEGEERQRANTLP